MPLMKFYRNVHKRHQTRKAASQTTIKNKDGKESYIVTEIKRVKQPFYQPFKVWLRQNNKTEYERHFSDHSIRIVEDSDTVERVLKGGES